MVYFFHRPFFLISACGILINTLFSYIFYLTVKEEWRELFKKSNHFHWCFFKLILWPLCCKLVMTNSMLFKGQRQIVFFLKNLKWKKMPFLSLIKDHVQRFLSGKSIVDPREVTWGRKTAAKNFKLKLISLIVYS